MRKIWRKAWDTAAPAAGSFVLSAASLSLALQPVLAAEGDLTKPAPPSLEDQKKWREPLPEDQKVLHLLSRITFGARSGDVERARRMGLDALLDEQLHPERISDSAVEARVAALPTLAMSSEELVENFPPPKQQLQARRDAERKGNQAAGTTRAGGPAMQAPNMAAMEGPRRVIMELAQEELLRATYSERQLQEVMAQFWMNHFNIFAPKGADKWLVTSFERDTIRPHALGKFQDLLVATATSPAMLFYLDNWLSSAPNGGMRGRPAPRGGFGRRWGGPFGRRRGPFGPPLGPLLGRGGGPRETRGEVPQPAKANRRGLNENYARELMELHTMGVEGGYTQKDVVEVARCLTGWTIERPRLGGAFIFRPEMHDFGKKVVLGHKIHSGHGMEDGLEVLGILARHPSTAHFIALKLARRFVADDPPPAVVDRATKTFLSTGGDIRAVLSCILTSPEFYSQAAYRAKVKSPLELVASSLRALGADTDAGLPLIRMIARMGQPMFQYQAPTGFPDRASTWINSGSLLARLNFATLLAEGRISGTKFDLAGSEGGQVAEKSAGGDTSAVALLNELAERLGTNDLSSQTRQAILKDAAMAGANAGANATSREAPAIAALLLASPEFQRR